MKLHNYASDLARNFSLDKWWKMYENAQKSVGA